MVESPNMSSAEIREQFLKFFEARGHKIVPSSSLVPENDPSVLLTSAGMQQFKPYFTGAANAEQDFGSKNTCSVQKCFRTSDIEEVGDERHLTFFEMLGNFSFGGYFKEGAIQLAHEFITKELNLPISYVTIFKGSNEVPKDEESRAIWQKLGVQDVREEGMEDVFWGPTGTEGPCGPTTEIYCKNAAGQDIEVWNLVFNQFYYPGTREELLAGAPGKNLRPLETPGVDTGMGLERLVMIAQKTPTIFETDLFKPLIEITDKNLSETKKRILADHARAISHLITDGVRPNNKGAGYILRRLIRRMISFGQSTNLQNLLALVTENPVVIDEFNKEKETFTKAMESGKRELEKISDLGAAQAFQLYETYGLPFELIQEKSPSLKKADFEAEFKKHQEVSRAGLEKKFAGGLADHEPATIKLHTAHHLLLAALKQVLGPEVKQKGSNITQERLRLDFSWPEKMTDEQKKQVEEIVNEKIKAALPVERREMPKVEAEKLGAEMEFGAKYGETVSVYLIGDFSKEFCGGPHVSNTSELGTFKILKEEAVAAGVRRIKAVVI